MAGHDSYLEPVAYHDHSDLVNTEFLLEILCVAGISESLVGHRPLVERGRN